MGKTAFRNEDRIGLAGAIILHLALVAALALQFVFVTPRDLAPERMTVSLATEVSLRSTAPELVEESRAAIAPTLAEEPTPPAEEVVGEVEPPPPPPPPPATTRTVARQEPRAPAPTRDRSRPDRQPEPSARTDQNSGGSRIGNNFLEGQGNSAETDDTRVLASEIGRSARASIIQSIVRQIRPHWNAPEGIDAELLVTELAFDLDENGRLRGRPRVIAQSGETASNRPQKALHAERAIRAVQLAQPFDLPNQYYNAWKSIRGARFDRNLSR